MNRADLHDRMRLGGYVAAPASGNLPKPPPGPAPGSAPKEPCCPSRAVLRDREDELLDLLGPCRVSSCRLHAAHRGQHQIGVPQ